MVCLFAKFQEWKDKRKEQFELVGNRRRCVVSEKYVVNVAVLPCAQRDRPDNPAGVEQQEQMQPE